MIITRREFGKYLSDCICNKGSTVQQLSIATEIEINQLIDYLSGNKEINAFSLYKILKFINISTNEFFYGLNKTKLSKFTNEELLEELLIRTGGLKYAKSYNL